MRTCHRLGDVSSIRDDQLQCTSTSAPNDAEPAQLEPSHDLARHADDNDYTDAQAHSHTRLRKRAGAQECERIVISGLCAPRHVRRHEERDASARSQLEAIRPKCEPTCSGPRAAARDNVWPPAEIERESGARCDDDDRLCPRVGDAHRCPRAACQHETGGSRRQGHRRPQRAHARTRGGGHKRKREDGGADDGPGHLPMTVNVTVAV